MAKGVTEEVGVSAAGEVDDLEILGTGASPRGLRKLISDAMDRVGASVPAALIISDLFVIGVLADRNLSWLVLAASFLSVATVGGYYRSRLSLLWLDEAPGLFGRFLVAGFTAQLVAELGGWSTPQSSRILLAASLVLICRAAVYAAVRYARRRHLVDHKTLIVGAGKIGHQLARTLHEQPEYGLRPVGFYDPEPLQLTSIPVIKDEISLDDAVTATDARVVILAFSQIPETDLVHSVRASVRLLAEVFYIPRLFDLHSLDVRDVDDAWGIPLVRLRRQAVRSRSWQLKRIMDVIVAAVLLIVTVPIMLLIGTLVRLRLGSPVLFHQRRVSIDDTEFTITKFRTLPEAAPGAGDVEWTSAEREPEALGRFLRATSLDELPQLVNVLRGDMSLVGPRPERAHFVRQFAEADVAYGQRHRVRSGLTGLAQVHGLRGDTSIEDRARFDNAYVERWSLSNDLKILLRTPLAAFRWRGR
jgi:exopolysaccharide biosynthesis polyprenyl glycosylphosphotransferase